MRVWKRADGGVGSAIVVGGSKCVNAGTERGSCAALGGRALARIRVDTGVNV